MTRILLVILKYVVTFLLGMCMAAASHAGDTASFSAMIAIGSLWFFSNSMRATA